MDEPPGDEDIGHNDGGCCQVFQVLLVTDGLDVEVGEFRPAGLDDGPNAFDKGS